MSLPLPSTRAQLYYDGHCPLCSKEMNLLRKLKNAQLSLVDIHQLLQINAEEQAQLLRNLHLQLPDGRWLLGVDANVAAWSFTPIGFLWKPLRWKIWSSGVDRVYQVWAKRRYYRNYACALAQGAKL